MLLIHHFKFPTGISLGVIIGILTIGILASMLANKKEARRGNTWDGNTHQAISPEEKQASQVVKQ
jgi:hypothetical protein